MKPEVVHTVGQVPLGLKNPLWTMIVKEPSNLPVTPAATVPPGFVSQPPGLGPAMVTNVPFLNSSTRVYVLSAFGVVLALKWRSKVSFAQSKPHVPESVDVLANGPYCLTAGPAR